MVPPFWMNRSLQSHLPNHVGLAAFGILLTITGNCVFEPYLIVKQFSVIRQWPYLKASLWQKRIPLQIMTS